MKPEYAKFHRHDCFFARNVDSIWCGGSRAKGDLSILSEPSKLWSLLEGRVSDPRYRRSPILNKFQWRWYCSHNDNGVEKYKASVFNKMKKFILEYYTELKNIKKSKVQSEMEERCANVDLEDFGQADDV